MFETSVIQGKPRVAAGRLSLLTISIIAHTAVVVGAIAVSIASVDFPTMAPDELAQAPTFLPVLVPPPLGNPNGGAVRQPEPAKPAAPPPQQPNQVTAPPVVPDDVPQLEAASTTTTGTYTGPAIPGATSTEPPGVPWGKEGSDGDINNPPGDLPAAPVPDRIYEAHEVKPPVGIYRPAPPYPQILIKTKVSATVVVRCVIDKNGRVRDPQVTVPARLAPFNDAVTEAVKQWRFTPGSLNGQAVDTYLSLTVHFSVR
jgi:periplasmic protein TonB